MAIERRERKEYLREYYIRNKDKFQSSRKEYYENNKEEIKLANKEYEKEFIKTPKGKYSIQKRHAKRRGIEWQFTFDEWWKVWQDSGKWNERGWGSESYVMCRTNDVGPYHKDNVRIDTHHSNLSEMGLERDSLGRFMKRGELHER